MTPRSVSPGGRVVRTGASGWPARLRADFARRELPDATRTDLDAAVRAARPGSLDFLLALGHEAGVPAAVAEARCAAVACSYAAVNLADDLADGDCDYLAEPYRSGPTTQYLLQSFFFSKIIELGIPSSVLAAVARDFERVAVGQHLEVATERWTFDLARDVALAITARQLVAYLRIVLFGRPLAEHAEALGLDVGLAAHVALDAESADPRYWSIEPAERRQLAKLALETIDRACALDLEAVAPVAAQVHRALDPEMGRG